MRTFDEGSPEQKFIALNERVRGMEHNDALNGPSYVEAGAAKTARDVAHAALTTEQRQNVGSYYQERETGKAAARQHALRATDVVRGMPYPSSAEGQGHFQTAISHKMAAHRAWATGDAGAAQQHADLAERAVQRVKAQFNDRREG